MCRNWVILRDEMTGRSNIFHRFDFIPYAFLVVVTLIARNFAYYDGVRSVSWCKQLKQWSLSWIFICHNEQNNSGFLILYTLFYPTYVQMEEQIW